MSYAINDGFRIHYETLGNGPPLVLQHGFTGTAESWREYGYAGPLTERHRLVLVDMRGHGSSDKPHEPSAYALSRHVSDIVAVLDAAGIERAHYWGYSRGGWIGLGFITEARDRVMKAIIGGSHPYARKMAGTIDGSDPLTFNREFSKSIGVDFDSLPPQRQRQLLAGDTKAWAAALQDRPSLEALMPTVTAKCLMYAGEEDGLFAGAKKGATLIPNCRFVAVPGGHGPAFWSSKAILPQAMQFLGEA